MSTRTAQAIVDQLLKEAHQVLTKYACKSRHLQIILTPEDYAIMQSSQRADRRPTVIGIKYAIAPGRTFVRPL